MVRSLYARRTGSDIKGERSGAIRQALALCAGAALCAISAPAFAQDGAADEYAALLQQIADLNTTTTQREFYASQQDAEIEALTAAVEAASDEESQVELLPMLRNMVAQLEEVMVEDLPINVERRFALLDDLREDISSDEASAYEGFRRALDLIGDEAELGLSVSYYLGNNPVDPGGRFAACQADPLGAVCDLSDDQKVGLENGAAVEDFNQLGQLPDGNYIHYGRLALLYLERDSSVGYRYNAASKQWDRISNSELLSLRQDVRIARGESAISTMSVPIEVGARSADDAS